MFCYNPSQLLWQLIQWQPAFCELWTFVSNHRCQKLQFYNLRSLVKVKLSYCDNFVWSQQGSNNWEGLYKVVRQDLTPKLLSDRVFINRYLRAYLPSKIRVILGIAQNVWDQIFIRYIYFWLHWCYLPRNKMHIKSKSRLVIATLRWMVLSRRAVNGRNDQK